MKWAHQWNLWDSTPNALVEDELPIILPKSLNWKYTDILRWVIFVLKWQHLNAHETHHYCIIFIDAPLRALEKAITSWQSKFYSQNIPAMRLNAPMKAIETVRSLFKWNSNWHSVNQKRRMECWAFPWWILMNWKRWLNSDHSDLDDRWTCDWNVSIVLKNSFHIVTYFCANI